LVPVGCVLAASLLHALLMFPLPLVMASIAHLRYRRSVGFAWIVALLSVFVAGVIDPMSIVAVIPVLAVTLWVVSVLDKVKPWRMALIVAMSSAVGLFVWLALQLMLEGMSFVQFTAMLAETQTSFGADAGLSGDSLGQFGELASETWPSVLLALTAVQSFIGVWLVGILARRAGAQAERFGSIETVDMSWHVVWPVTAGFTLLAWDQIVATAPWWASTLGWNLLLAMWMVLSVQGLGVAEGLFKRWKMGTIPRLILYGVLLWAGVLLPAAGAIGLADLWLNARRLPRGGTPDIRVESTDETDVK